ncbi:MAG TPA: ATP-binding cassette domain-containing protein [Stellaceae bacterium]|nr:ATP-binding cassette domain-containing protein [Stellaceae bacterium]
MEKGHAILELVEAVPRESRASLSLQIRAGEFVLIQCRDPAWATAFAEFCCGLLPPQEGVVRFYGLEWTRLSSAHAAALRGRIGRIFSEGGWINFLDTETNILLSQLHHTRRSRSDLRSAAVSLAHDFGLPGLPTDLPSTLSPGDLARASCVRAFLGEPLLLVLESPLHAQYQDLALPLINAALAACNRSAAVLWLTPGDVVWTDRSTPASARLRLSEQGLTRVRGVA